MRDAGLGQGGSQRRALDGAVLGEGQRRSAPIGFEPAERNVIATAHDFETQHNECTSTRSRGASTGNLAMRSRKMGISPVQQLQPRRLRARVRRPQAQSILAQRSRRGRQSRSARRRGPPHRCRPGRGWPRVQAQAGKQHTHRRVSQPPTSSATAYGRWSANGRYEASFDRFATKAIAPANRRQPCLREITSVSVFRFPHPLGSCGKRKPEIRASR